MGEDENSQNMTIVWGATCASAACLVVGVVAVLCYRNTRPPPSLRPSNDHVDTEHVYCEIASTPPPPVPDETGGSYDYVYCHMNAYCESAAVQPPPTSEDPTQVYDYAYGRATLN